VNTGVAPNDRPALPVSNPNTGDNNDPDDAVVVTTPANVTNGVNNPDHEHPDHSVVPTTPNSRNNDISIDIITPDDTSNVDHRYPRDPLVVITSDTSSTVDNPADQPPDLPKFPTLETCKEINLDEINEILSFLREEVL
jgi:hypothetical protein